MPTVITIENLGKKYCLGHQREQKPYVTLRDVIADTCRGFVRRLASGHHPSPTFEDFWALNDVSFDVKQGDRVGIIGRNGAGKSTLLKVLSRITEPTTGSLKIKGRVASLLEVGTGFHPELTGRENIFLNGAILGMSRNEIRKKFDEIVGFAEIERFLDTPVKHYSSGMYVRLAFAVAAHLEPEILIIDEVLAVGDAQFQKKCLGKMEEISAAEGRTVLFVSHALQAVAELCNKAVLLDGGRLIESGSVAAVVEKYLCGEKERVQGLRDLRDPALRVQGLSNPASAFRLEEISLLNSSDETVGEVKFEEPFEIVLKGRVVEYCENVTIGMAVSSTRIGHIFSTHQIYNGLSHFFDPGCVEFRVRLDPNILAPGHYQIEVGATGPLRVGDYIREALSFSISDAPFKENLWRPTIQAGFLYYPCMWRQTGADKGTA